MEKTIKRFITLLTIAFLNAGGLEAKPIKVFILAVQSNMESQGSVHHGAELANGGKGFNLFWPPHEFFGKLVFYKVDRDHIGQICCNLNNLRLRSIKL